MTGEQLTLAPVEEHDPDPGDLDEQWERYVAGLGRMYREIIDSHARELAAVAAWEHKGGTARGRQSRGEKPELSWPISYFAWPGRPFTEEKARDCALVEVAYWVAKEVTALMFDLDAAHCMADAANALAAEGLDFHDAWKVIGEAFDVADDRLTQKIREAGGAE